VIVTSKMLRTTVAGAKSDRLDCRTLAEHACKYLLKPGQVPTEQQERDRQLMRLRERLARKQRLARQQIKSFLLVHGIAQPPLRGGCLRRRRLAR
jgi:transposase